MVGEGVVLDEAEVELKSVERLRPFCGGDIVAVERDSDERREDGPGIRLGGGFWFCREDDRGIMLGVGVVLRNSCAPAVCVHSCDGVVSLVSGR